MYFLGSFYVVTSLSWRVLGLGTIFWVRGTKSTSDRWGGFWSPPPAPDKFSRPPHLIGLRSVFKLVISYKLVIKTRLFSSMSWMQCGMTRAWVPGSRIELTGHKLVNANSQQKHSLAKCGFSNFGKHIGRQPCERPTTIPARNTSNIKLKRNWILNWLTILTQQHLSSSTLRPSHCFRKWCCKSSKGRDEDKAQDSFRRHAFFEMLPLRRSSFGCC